MFNSSCHPRIWKIWHQEIKKYFDLPVNALFPVLERNRRTKVHRRRRRRYGKYGERRSTFCKMCAPPYHFLRRFFFFFSRCSLTIVVNTYIFARETPPPPPSPGSGGSGGGGGGGTGVYPYGSLIIQVRY